MNRILVFTDSRGQHVPAGETHKIFGERLRDQIKNVEVDLVLCPMKWTTTLDFFEYLEKIDSSKYDWIVLYTGIVEWSPRSAKSAYHDLYDNKKPQNLGAYDINSRDYSKKIVNNKKALFDSLFGEIEVQSYLCSPWEVEYEGERTINMYSIDMAREYILPKLKLIPNLIYINANRILPSWEGDFKRGRPENMYETHAYADLFSSEIDAGRLVDLSRWSDQEVKEYTCDNIHLTGRGSDFVFEELCRIMSLEKKANSEIVADNYVHQMESSVTKLIQFGKVERFIGAKKEKFLSSVTQGGQLATLIIGLKLKDNSPERVKNLKFLLDWIEYHYEDMFDVLLVEQGSIRKLPTEDFTDRSYVRYEFIYNPEDYNRGWGYNVAARHFCKDSTVIVPMDTDVLTSANFVSDVRDCYIGKFDVISPYQNIYYTDKEEADEITSTMSLSHLADEGKIKNPVSITGGIAIFNRQIFMGLKGYEQYIGYGCEDRALDVAVMGLCEQSKVKISPVAYVHLYHPTDSSARTNFDDIYKHLVDNYQCQWTPGIQPAEFIHSKCKHASKDKVVSLMLERAKSFGDLDLYKKNSKLLPNGVIQDYAQVNDSVIIPPDFSGLGSYRQRELYDAPEPCRDELAQFRNKFLGKRCFIIGNGPSLNKHDLSLLENEYTFGVNSFYYKTRETGFRPYFYVVEDNSVMKENIQEIRDYYAPFKFFPTVYKRMHPKTPNTFFFEMNRGFYEKSSPNYAVPRFSTDATKELYCGQSVTYINLQLAYFMGFTEVYLIGMDFSYVIPKSHKRTGDVLLSDSDDPNHFHKDYFGKGKTWKDPKLERVGNNYRMAKVVYESVGRKIYNATVGGSLEIFDRVDYDALFDSQETEVKLPDVDSDDAFSEANKLYQAGQFADALVRYVALARKHEDFYVYKEAAMSAYLKAKRDSQPVMNEIASIVKEFL